MRRPTGETLARFDLGFLMAQRLVAQAVYCAAGYFLSGVEELYERALALLQLSANEFGSTGDVIEYHLIVLLRRVLPRMHHRSTWQLLAATNGDLNRWRRYLLLLARGGGAQLENQPGIAELWPSQITAIRAGLISKPGSMAIRMPTSAGKTRVAEMAIVDHLIAYD